MFPFGIDDFGDAMWFLWSNASQETLDAAMRFIMDGMYGELS